MLNKNYRAGFIYTAGLVVVLCSAASLAIAQQGGGGGGRGAAQPFMTHQVNDHVYWVEGGGGNTGVIIGKTGVIVVDTKTNPAGGTEFIGDVAKITPKPITTVILTHSDNDHVGGLPSFPKGITIIAQEGDKTEMDAAVKTPNGAALADHMPTRIVTKNKENITIDGVKLTLLHFAPAHTSGDLMVYLPSDKIMFTGDIVAMQSPYPLIHLEKNGSSEGWITTMNGMLKTPATTFVPGHGANVVMKADLQKRLADTIARRDQIKMLAAQGKSLDEVRQALNETPPPARGGGGAGQAGRGGAPAAPNFQDFTAVVYAESKKT